jgi:competence CoiA-like predicted nuclease
MFLALQQGFNFLSAQLGRYRHAQIYYFQIQSCILCTVADLSDICSYYQTKKLKIKQTYFNIQVSPISAQRLHKQETTGGGSACQSIQSFS